jgi:hypothetical protein
VSVLIPNKSKCLKQQDAYLGDCLGLAVRSLSIMFSEALNLRSSLDERPSRVSGAETSLIGCTLGMNGWVASRTGRGATRSGAS